MWRGRLSHTSDGGMSPTRIESGVVIHEPNVTGAVARSVEESGDTVPSAAPWMATGPRE